MEVERDVYFLFAVIIYVEDYGNCVCFSKCAFLKTIYIFFFKKYTYEQAMSTGELAKAIGAVRHTRDSSFPSTDIHFCFRKMGLENCRFLNKLLSFVHAGQDLFCFSMEVERPPWF